MLAIRMQRTGRKGHAHFRVVVQDSRQSPTSGKFVALVGNYDPHTKVASLEKEKIEFYLEHGAQPSNRTAILFKKEGLKLPEWVKIDTGKQGKTRNPEKLSKEQPAETKAEVDTETTDEAPVKEDEEANAEQVVAEAVVDASEEKTDEKTEVEEQAAETTDEK